MQKLRSRIALHEKTNVKALWYNVREVKNMQIFNKGDHQIFHGDALEVLKNSIPDQSVDLIFVDPPYNIGKNFNGRKDKWATDEEYLSWCYQWIDQLF
jgi:site-specific DNA-methyltransferase (adenine-specific)